MSRTLRLVALTLLSTLAGCEGSHTLTTGDFTVTDVHYERSGRFTNQILFLDEQQAGYSRAILTCDEFPAVVGRTYHLTLDYWTDQPGCITIR